ncbi:MAG: hypothetical protein L6W00_13395 [Lentisphaeria bacterium]|nr:MAG: hypothetical protein L6W00_13395 [Lentisphaeria bacterium]
MTLDTAEIPDTRSRETSRFGILRHPRLEQQVIDYSRYTSDLTAETILLFTRAARRMTGGRKAIGVFYGYLMYIPERQDEGHFSLGKVLADDSIDFLASPSSYRFRQTGGAGTSHFMTPVGSVRLHGKLWIDENDIRTSISYKKRRRRLGTARRSRRRPPPADQGAGQRHRQRLRLLVVQRRLQPLRSPGDSETDRKPRPAVPTARSHWTVRRSTASPSCSTPPDRTTCAPAGARRRSSCWNGSRALSRSGAAFGHYITDDLDRLADHKLLLFPFSIAPDPAQVRALEKLKNSNRILVFFNGADSFPHRPGAPKGKNGDFTGIRIAKSKHSIPGDFTFSDVPGFTDGLAGNSSAARRSGSIRPFSPTLPGWWCSPVTAGTIRSSR